MNKSVLIALCCATTLVMACQQTQQSETVQQTFDLQRTAVTSNSVEFQVTPGVQDRYYVAGVMSAKEGQSDKAVAASAYALFLEDVGGVTLQPIWLKTAVRAKPL